MKLTIVSHACVTPVNQSFYAAVERLTSWSIEIITPSVWKDGYRSVIEVSRWEGLQAQISPIPVWGAGNIPLHFYKNWLVGYLSKSNPNAIYVHHEPYGLATAQVYLANAVTKRVPIGNYAAQNINKRYPIPFRWFESTVLRNTDFAFPVTEGALSVLREKGYRGPAQVLPLPVDQEIYYRRSERAEDCRRRNGISPKQFVIGYLGRLVEEKGIDTLLLALDILKHREWQCVLAGSGAYENCLRKTVSEKGLEDRVTFVGYVPHEEAPIWLSLFDVLVLPSESRANWTEQFGRVLVEANACGTPVVGSNCGEISSVIHSTGGGLIVPEADPEALANALLDLLDNPTKRDELAVQGLMSINEKYGQDYIAGLFASEIEAVVASKRTL